MQINKIQAPMLSKTYNNKNNQAKQVSFSGNPAELAGKLVGKGSLTKFANAIEFDSINMPFPVLATVMIFGVIIPRLLQAQDEYDREEIMRRDLISTVVITTAQPVINKSISQITEAKSGLALATKPAGAKSGLKKILSYLNPIGGVQVLNGDQIVSKYSKIDGYKNGIAGFCDFVTGNGGNLKKMFSYEKGGTKELVEKIVGKDIFEAGDNKAIRDGLAKAAEKGTKEIAELYSKFADKNNPFVIKAKSLNSTFGFLSMFLLVPALLGFAIPKVNERITKKKFLERQAAEQAKTQNSIQNISKLPAQLTNPLMNSANTKMQ